MWHWQKKAKPSSESRDAVIGNGVRLLRMTEHAFSTWGVSVTASREMSVSSWKLQKQHSGIAGDYKVVLLSVYPVSLETAL